MKKVRFETPDKAFTFPKMNDSECHSPRPFIERHTQVPEISYNYPRVITYSSDPVKRFESSNSSPYPTVNKTSLPDFRKEEPHWTPSNDLELSMLDASGHEPRIPVFCKPILKTGENNNIHRNMRNILEHNSRPLVLSSSENKQNFCQSDTETQIKNKIEGSGHSEPQKDFSEYHLRLQTSNENKPLNPPNILTKESDFFIQRDNLDKFNFKINPLQSCMNRLSLGKENESIAKKHKLQMGLQTSNLQPDNFNEKLSFSPNLIINDQCKCHHCIKVVNSTPYNFPHVSKKIPIICEGENSHQIVENVSRPISSQCHCVLPQPNMCSHCNHNTPPVTQNVCKMCRCQTEVHTVQKPQDAVDKKTWIVDKYEQNKKTDCMEVEKQANIVKEKREPTVADLFKIIKLQNEHLQLLQEKVDKFISASQPAVQNTQPIQSNILSKHVSLETVDSDHKISIGVMTSFEMVRTSTIINKEVVKQTNDNAQVQCNRSQISIKEVISKPVNLNFLDGIAHVGKTQSEFQNDCNALSAITAGQQNENVLEEKTLNELSLYNVQIDNATTPLMSPDQSLYLDVRDYSDSDACSDDQSNVGWTYYNKVMTHVNGMLQDSDMPSSASALYRNTRQQCMQMQIDKTNVSVTKRVKFGDDPLGLHQQHVFTAASTDTSLKMNQLAAKYLKNGPAPQLPQQQISKPFAAPIDMSFATRNYMERHKLLHGMPQSSKLPQSGEMVKFLDITALKRQPKLL